MSRVSLAGSMIGIIPKAASCWLMLIRLLIGLGWRSGCLCGLRLILCLRGLCWRRGLLVLLLLRLANDGWLRRACSSVLLWCWPFLDLAFGPFLELLLVY